MTTRQHIIIPEELCNCNQSFTEELLQSSVLCSRTFAGWKNQTALLATNLDQPSASHSFTQRKGTSTFRQGIQLVRRVLRSDSNVKFNSVRRGRSSPIVQTAERGETRSSTLPMTEASCRPHLRDASRTPSDSISSAAAAEQPACILGGRGKVGEGNNATSVWALTTSLRQTNMASRFLLQRIQSAGRLSGGHRGPRLLRCPLPPAGDRSVCSNACGSQIKTDTRITVCSAVSSSIP